MNIDKLHFIIKQIWKMPFYEVLLIAFIDDVILFFKAWPFLILIISLLLIYYSINKTVIFFKKDE